MKKLYCFDISRNLSSQLFIAYIILIKEMFYHWGMIEKEIWISFISDISIYFS